MGAVAAVLVTVSVSLIITKVGTTALALTGLSSEVARFQARSAFFGVGFTTVEAESVVNHPLRRRIVLWLILLGNAGIVSILATIVISFANDGGQTWQRLGELGGGLALLALLASSGWVTRRLERLIDVALRRWAHLDVRDYAELLHLAGPYSVIELKVETGDWVAERPLAELGLRDEGIVVLGVTRADGDWIGAPDGDTIVHAADTLVLYGREDRLAELDARSQAFGDVAHAAAVAEQARLEAEEEAREAAAAR